MAIIFLCKKVAVGGSVRYYLVSGGGLSAIQHAVRKVEKGEGE